MKLNKKILSASILLLSLILLFGSVNFNIRPVAAQEIQYQVEVLSQEIQGSPRSPLDDQRVLLIGDSQTVGNFGSGMMAHLTAHGATYFVRAGREGWGVVNWWNHRFNIKRLIRRHNPTLVLVELGGNDFWRANHPSLRNYSNYVENLWNFIKDNAEENKPHNTTVSYCWISPATTVGPAADIQDERDEISNVIQTVVGSDYYVESRDITGSFGRTADGKHFTPAGGNDWASRLIPRIKSCISHQL